MSYLHERRRPAGRLHAQPQRPRERDRGAAAGIRSRNRSQGSRRPRSLQHHGLRPRADAADEASGARQARGADHPRRGAHVRYGVAVPRSSASTPARASSTSRTMPRCSCTTRNRRTARFWKRASPRPARWRRSRRPARPTPTTACEMIPFFIYYSMFGFQRVGDLIWAFADARGKGFLWAAPPAAPRWPAKACSTRTATASCSPARFPPASTYDPAYAYEIADHHAGRHPPHVSGAGRPSSTT